jgi:hypothetical protein
VVHRVLLVKAEPLGLAEELVQAVRRVLVVCQECPGVQERLEHREELVSLVRPDQRDEVALPEELEQAVPLVCLEVQGQAVQLVQPDKVVSVEQAV